MNVMQSDAICTGLRAVTVAERFGYAARFAPVGQVVCEVGSLTQMGNFPAIRMTESQCPSDLLQEEYHDA